MKVLKWLAIGFVGLVVLGALVGSADGEADGDADAVSVGVDSVGATAVAGAW